MGAYLTHEFAFEAAALTNPSMVPAPDQSGLPAGALRFVLSLRAVSEGHISSIKFRTGVMGADGSVDRTGGPRAETGERRPPVYERKLFGVKLGELGADTGLTARVLDQLARHFGPAELERALMVLDDIPGRPRRDGEARQVAGVVELPGRVRPGHHAEERVVFPTGPFESHGMEDARFVRLAEDDGTTNYYATYTAFDGFEILPQLIETNDFSCFEITTMNGPSAQNKGSPCSPGSIGGRYVGVDAARPGEHPHHQLGQPPLLASAVHAAAAPAAALGAHPMGNCGSPLETSEGWLVLTHGVGPMRTYRLGAMLLDLDDPNGSSPTYPIRSWRPTTTSATVMSPTSCTPAGGSSTATGSWCPTGSPTVHSVRRVLGARTAGRPARQRRANAGHLNPALTVGVAAERPLGW